MKPNTLWERELGSRKSLKAEDIVNGADVVDRLDLYREMEGHEGCVNALKWNQAGTLIASGSDDTCIRLWDVDGNCRVNHETSHIGNIFGVEFVPGMGDNYILSGAGDGQVILSEMERGEEVCKWTAPARVKRLASTPSTHRICWSISEERCVRMLDTRDSQVDVKFSIGNTGKSLDVSHIQPHWIGVGTESTVVSIYDERNTARPVMQVGPLDKRPNDNYYVTHLTFSKKTNSLLVNYGRGSTYLFDLNESSKESVFCAQIDQLMEVEAQRTLSTGRESLSSLVNDTIEEVETLTTERKYAQSLQKICEILKRDDVSPFERSSILLKRCSVYKGRKREGDSYASARDALSACLLSPSHPDPLLRLISVLVSMEQVTLCNEMISLFKTRFPESVDRVAGSEESLASLSLPDRRRRNLRENGARMRDYESRYTGHLNENTDIKEAAFFGPNEDFILSASDSGHIFIYDRRDATVATLLKADSSVVNGVQPHPFLPLLASSGIDNEWCLFAPYSSSLSFPLPPSLSRRVSHSEAESHLARVTTNNFVRDLVLLSRLRGEDAVQQQCQVS